MRNEHEYQLPFVRIETFRNFPLYTLPATWNELGSELQHQSNKMTFSLVLKDFLFTLLANESGGGSHEP
jgi:hypothetical protein